MLATWCDSDSSSELKNDNDNLCLIAHENSTKDSKTLIKVTIDNLFNGPNEVVKDIFLSLLMRRIQLLK